MVSTDQVQELFSDARSLHASALERVDAGDIRDAAEKAWAATRRATEALILSETGNVPTTSAGISGGLRALGRGSAASRSLQDRYGATARFLHSDCFYNGNCDPIEDTIRRIRETAIFIDDAEDLAKGV